MKKLISVLVMLTFCAATLFVSSCTSHPNEEQIQALEEARAMKSIIILKPTPAKLFNNRKIAFIFTPDRYIIEFLETETSEAN